MQVAGALQAQPSYRTWGALPRKDPWLSLGIGGSFELDQMAVVPAMRVRFQDWLTIKVRNFTRGISLAAPVLCAKLTRRATHCWPCHMTLSSEKVRGRSARDPSGACVSACLRMGDATKHGMPLDQQNGCRIIGAGLLAMISSRLGTCKLLLNCC